MNRLVTAHGIGVAVAIVAWQVAIAAPDGPTDVRLVLAGLVGPVLAGTASLAAIAAGQDRRQQPTPTPVPQPRREPVTAPRRRELAR